jgi:hypothetical protein
MIYLFGRIMAGTQIDVKPKIFPYKYFEYGQTGTLLIPPLAVYYRG